MPEQDDDALGDILSDRLKGTKDDEEDGEQASEAEESPASEGEAPGEETSPSAEGEPGSTGSAERTQITEADGDAAATDLEGDDADEDGGTTRSRSPFPLYIRPSLKESVNQRFDRFNAERTLDDEPQVEKHAHFIQGLLRAGLDHPELEEYVLEEFREE